MEVDLDLEILSKRFEASYSKNTQSVFQGELPQYKLPFENRRAYKDDYIPAIIIRNQKREIVPLRFNLLPSFSHTNKYGMIDKKSGKFKEFHTYNATIERLNTAKAYKNLFMQRHCIIPVKGFYEWINPSSETKAKEALFYSSRNEFLTLAGLWDSWNAQSLNEGINSCAVITTPPRLEVTQAGHDRSPLIIDEVFMSDWLNLTDKEKVQVAISHPLVEKLSFKTL